MIRINLLGDALAQSPAKKDRAAEPAAVYAQGEETRKASFPVAGLLVGVLFSAVGGLYYLYLSREIEKEEVRKVKLEAEKKELEKYIEMERRFRAQKADLDKKKKVLSELRQAQRLPVHLLEELANCLPDDVWFESIKLVNNTVSIAGESSSFEAVNLFRNKLLAQTKYFQKVNYPTGNKTGNGSVIKYSISFELKNPG